VGESFAAAIGGALDVCGSSGAGGTDTLAVFGLLQPNENAKTVTANTCR